MLFACAKSKSILNREEGNYKEIEEIKRQMKYANEKNFKEICVTTNAGRELVKLPYEISCPVTFAHENYFHLIFEEIYNQAFFTDYEVWITSDMSDPRIKTTFLVFIENNSNNDYRRGHWFSKYQTFENGINNEDIVALNKFVSSQKIILSEKLEVKSYIKLILHCFKRNYRKDLIFLENTMIPLEDNMDAQEVNKIGSINKKFTHFPYETKKIDPNRYELNFYTWNRSNKILLSWNIVVGDDGAILTSSNSIIGSWPSLKRR